MRDKENKAENAEKKAVRDFEQFITRHCDAGYLRRVFMDMLVGYSRYIQNEDDLYIGDPDAQIYYLYQLVQILDGEYADNHAQTE